MSKELLKYDLLFDSIDMGIICQQADGRVIEVNRSAVRMLGIPKRN